ncbi:MAG: FKBP-type peptidyl-prolyl cis-trans isomerase [Bacteroidales bacterium]|jgi:hypothetical protein|nr:FKBP-type peptidyl-prolyl cis-trans isomerase [Bacteroidales bacterium]MDD2263963.1 FKBP-type peptidyl-prolyl cis-trans isomerase [Bacteroidales bacterium]MDD2831197.1 FKBP-type peptidyl-prolyl cis-trans isomerase [Bacteroidales bacterium]MDD3208690.1 FKBP-type peptidyl-prolyl cis-trans isomerase [Bacteroidales bacterium]MDD3697253.1 FKBP-type peptidyl-prolyl cis-trans isomerase [Bacteroidales bacterium]
MRTYFVLLTGFLLTLASCTREDRKLMLVRQEEEIDKFVMTLTKDTVFYQQGVVRAVLEKGSSANMADTAARGDTIYFYYAGHVFSKGKGELFHTNSDSVAAVYKRTLTPDQAVVRSGAVGEGKFLKGLDYGLTGMSPGEHSYVIFNADYGFGNITVGQVPRMSPLLFEIWVERIVKK